MASIPEFPAYARVDSRVRDQISEFTDGHLPYSDFNSVNIQSWDLAGTAQVTMLHQNLVLRLPDYVDGTEFFSFLGNNEVNSTADVLLDEAERHSHRRELRLVPEIGAIALERSGLFGVQEDLDGHDYVLSLPAIVAKFGSGFRNMRRAINTFETKYGPITTFQELDIANPLVQSKIIDVFLSREEVKTGNDYKSELEALGRLFTYADHQLLASYGLEINGELKAFIIYEKLGNQWCVGHFWKADTNYKGIYRYLMYGLAEKLATEGYRHFNIEQDLGIAGLKHMKRLFCPIGRLKKYTITDQL